MTFGHGSADFLVDETAAVAQAVKTRLLLFQGEWFLNLDEGTPWLTQVVGDHTRPLADMALKTRILGTLGVRAILAWSSSFNPVTRHFAVETTIDTVFSGGPATISVLVPPGPGPFILDQSTLDGPDALN